MKSFMAVCVAVILFSGVQAFADNFRCPNGNIVSSGDSISIVAAKCDPPVATFKREEPMESDVIGKTGTKLVYVEVQEWTYKEGSTLLHVLIFRNGILAEVRTGGFVQ